MTRWKSQLRWDDDNQTTHDDKTYELWAHGYSTGKNGPSRDDAWHLHRVLDSGQTHPEPLSIPLSGNWRQAKKLGELWVLGWRNAPGTLSPEHGYREMWRAPDGELHPIADVLSGVVPH
ncbi:hypothetical protein [Streptomyces sp. RTd22]|uniref:hypothetical protein n=1 Tax=Streptomyces sp. RTd22 TaxID=1841249 RepID=UPI0007C56FED|nr:hypothetical protein [Streptomyces sp. RTd22]